MLAIAAWQASCNTVSSASQRGWTWPGPWPPLSILSPDSAKPSFQVARGFPILQDDKVRQVGDDWLRSQAKSKPPSAAHTLLIIDWTFAPDSVRAEPGPARIARLVAAIQGFLDSDTMSASDCSPLTGRLCFTCTWVFGHVGRSFFSRCNFANTMATLAPADSHPVFARPWCSFKDSLDRFNQFASLCVRTSAGVLLLICTQMPSLHCMAFTEVHGDGWGMNPQFGSCAPPLMGLELCSLRRANALYPFEARFPRLCSQTWPPPGPTSFGWRLWHRFCLF